MSETPNQPSRQPPIGIDLGTTYSAIAYLDLTGRPTMIANAAGELLTPSALLFENDGIVVGKEAIKASVFEPHVFADCFKRDMGSARFRRAIGPQDVPPEVLSGFILERLKLDAECCLGPIRKVVITVPAFFDETRRRATQEAGRLAGLEVLDIINEPTAAAIAFTYYRTRLPAYSNVSPAKLEHILVYDLGGGTFDVSVLQIEGHKVRTLATDGDVQLGGRDFDERLVNHIANQFLATHGVDPRSDLHDAAQFWLDVQAAKHALSERLKVVIPCIHSGIRMRVEVTRSEFEQLTSDLLQRTEMTSQLVLRQANLDWKAVDRVLLVGGSSRMPMVAEMLRRVSGKEPDRSLSPDEVVTHGAAIYAGTLMEKTGVIDAARVEVVNVNSHSLGIIGIDRRTNRRQNVVLIPKNTPLPCQAVRKFATATDDQRTVNVAVVEGESSHPQDCIALGSCVIRGLPPGLPKDTSIEVEYRYSANGRISVFAKVPSVRQSATVEIVRDREHLADLDSWRRRLCPGFSITATKASAEGREMTAASEALEPHDRANILNRLDGLLADVGEHAMQMELPEELQKCKAIALTAAQEFQSAGAKLQRLEIKGKTAVGQSEVLRATADVAQALTGAVQMKTKLRFAYIALGRACLASNYWPGELEALAAEIQSLQRSIGI